MLSFNFFFWQIQTVAIRERRNTYHLVEVLPQQQLQLQQQQQETNTELQHQHAQLPPQHVNPTIKPLDLYMTREAEEEEIAKQITLLDFELFSNIRVSER